MLRSNGTGGLRFMPEDFPLLYVGDTTEYQISGLPNRTITIAGRPFVGVDSGGELQVGICGPDPDVFEDVISARLNGKADVSAAFHAAQALQYLQRLEIDTVHQLLHLGNRTACCNPGEKDRIQQEVGESQMENILMEEPEEFIKLLELLEREGISIDIRAIERELLEGALNFSIQLELRGVRPAKVILARRARGNELLEPYDPRIERLLMSLVDTMNLPPDIVESLRTEIRGRTLDNIARGVDDPVLTLGTAYVRAIYKKLGSFDPISLLMSLVYNNTSSGAFREALTLVSEHLATEFPVTPSPTNWAHILWESVRSKRRLRDIVTRKTGARHLERVAREGKAIEALPIKDVEAEA